VRGIDLEFESGESSLQVRHFTAFERISWPFEIQVACLSNDPGVDLEALVGKGVGLSVRSVVTRAWTGICKQVGQVRVEDEHEERSTYVLTIVPSVWLLSQRRGHRIYQHLSIPDIAEKILKEWAIEFDMSKVARGDYPKLEYCLQYGETDLMFISRLLERAGITYYFDEKVVGGRAKSQMTLSDRPHWNDLRGSIPWVDKPNQESRKEFVTNVVLGQEVAPGQYNFRDFEFRRPDYQLVGKSGAAPAPEDQYETYSYLPGGSLVEVSSAPDAMPVGDDKSTARHDGQKYASDRALVGQQAQRRHKRYVQYRTNALDLHPGTIFVVDRHPHSELASDKKLLVIGCRTDADATSEWIMTGEAVFADTPYRPAQVMF
jgi:type VI secretion system secreted protein VgrG